jgi:hypothetical protein
MHGYRKSDFIEIAFFLFYPFDNITMLKWFHYKEKRGMMKMRMTIEHHFEQMKKEVRGKMKRMLVPTKENWVKVFEALKKEKELEFHTATIKLETLTINGKKQEVMAIYHEQSTDYIIMFHQIHEDEEKRTIHIDFYSFNHYYNEEDEDDSLAKKVIEEDKIENYQPIYTIHHTSFKDNEAEIDLSGSDDDIYEFGEIDSMSITYGNMMCDLYDEKGMDEMVLFETKEFVENKLKELSLGQKTKIAQIHDTLQQTKKVGLWELQRIKIKEPQEEPDEIDMVFQQKFNLAFKEETDEDCYRPVLIMKKEDMHYLIVVENLRNDEYDEEYDFSFHVCHPNHDFFPTLEKTMNEYTSYKVRPIYQISYNHTKKPRARIFDTTGSLSDIYYFCEIEEIIKEIERIIL